MLPFFEAKGGFYLGYSLGLPIWLSILTTVVAGAFISLLLLFFYDTLIAFLSNTKMFKKLAIKITDRQNKKIKTFENKNKNKSTLAKLFAITLFVAIPLPLTGIYTGSLIASGLKLNKPLSLLAITIGNLIAVLILAFPLIFI